MSIPEHLLKGILSEERGVVHRGGGLEDLYVLEVLPKRAVSSSFGCGSVPLPENALWP